METIQRRFPQNPGKFCTPVNTKALSHALKRWPTLIRYADTGHLPIDNNACENTIRPIAIGRKNYLFVGTERAGKRAAAIQSLLGTAKLNGHDPAAWLKETLEKLPAWPNSKIDELLPFGHNEVDNTTTTFREYAL